MWGLWLANIARRLENERRARERLHDEVDVIVVLRDRANHHAAAAMTLGLRGDWEASALKAALADAVAELEAQHIEGLRFWML